MNKDSSDYMSILIEIQRDVRDIRNQHSSDIKEVRDDKARVRESLVRIEGVVNGNTNRLNELEGIYKQHQVYMQNLSEERLSNYKKAEERFRNFLWKAGWYAFGGIVLWVMTNFVDPRAATIIEKIIAIE